MTMMENFKHLYKMLKIDDRLEFSSEDLLPRMNFNKTFNNRKVLLSMNGW